MTEKDLLEALSRVNSKYTDEARERAEAAARKKPRRIMMRRAAAAVGAAACFGLVLFGLSRRTDPEINVAEEDLAEQVTQIVQTSETVTGTSAVLSDSAAVTSDKNKTTKTTSAGKSQTAVTTSAENVTTEAGDVQTTAAGMTGTTAASAASGTTAAPAAEKTTPYTPDPVELNGLIFDFVPKDQTDWISAYDYSLANHVYRAEPGEDLWIDMRMKNSPKIRYGYTSLKVSLGDLEYLEYQSGTLYDQCYAYDVSSDYHILSCTLINAENEQAVAAGDSPMLAFHIKVPEKTGRYTVTVAETQEEPMYSNVVNSAFSYYGNGVGYMSSSSRKFTVYGLDILVGDESLPEPAEPRRSDTLSRNSDASDDTEKVKERMWIGTGSTTVCAGDPRQPIGLFVLDNDGFDKMTLQIVHAVDMKAVEDENGIIFEPSEEFADITWSVTKTRDDLLTFSFDRGNAANLKTDGLIGTFYLSIPPIDGTDLGFEYILTISADQILYADGTPLTYYNDKGVEARLRIIG